MHYKIFFLFLRHFISYKHAGKLILYNLFSTNKDSLLKSQNRTAKISILINLFLKSHLHFVSCPNNGFYSKSCSILFPCLPAFQSRTILLSFFTFTLLTLWKTLCWFLCRLSLNLSLFGVCSWLELGCASLPAYRRSNAVFLSLDGCPEWGTVSGQMPSSPSWGTTPHIGPFSHLLWTLSRSCSGFSTLPLASVFPSPHNAYFSQAPPLGFLDWIV